MATPIPPTPSIPVLFLKTKSSPSDAYEEHFSQTAGFHGSGFDPIFVPVLEHRFDDDGLARLRDILVRRRISLTEASPAGDIYGGMIFTSQRAVDAFARIVSEGAVKDSDVAAWPHLQGVPIYSVGPATTRALKAVPQQPPLQVVGGQTGNGEDLAYFIRKHYADAQPAPAQAMLPLLFLVGEKRRDVIPKVLTGTEDGHAPIRVDEVVVYSTGVMASFPDDLHRVLGATHDRPYRWIVVFSPTGCENLLAGLGLLDAATGRVHASVAAATASAAEHGRTFVATIGPTTRAYLRDTFGFEPDVCADEPTPAGVARGIASFMAVRSAAP